MNQLKNKNCVPCEDKTKPLEADEIINLRQELKSPWQVVDNKRLRQEFIFKNFIEAMLFVNKIVPLAEREGHHPDLHIFYNKVVVELWTHAIGGLSENDFILAAKVETIPRMC